MKSQVKHDVSAHAWCMQMKDYNLSFDPGMIDNHKDILLSYENRVR